MAWLASEQTANGSRICSGLDCTDFGIFDIFKFFLNSFDSMDNPVFLIFIMAQAHGQMLSM
jgi:hypothetical protein